MRVMNSASGSKRKTPSTNTPNEEMMDPVPNDPNFFQGPTIKGNGEPSLMSRIIQGATILTAFAVVVGWATTQGGHLYQLNKASPTASQTPGETTNNFMVQAPSAPQITNDLRKNMTILAENEYGRIDQASLLLYGLDMVVEPHRETTLCIEGARVPHALFHWKLFEVDDEGAPLDGVDPILDAVGGTRATVVLKSPGHMFRLEVRERGFSEESMSCVAVTVSCRYVRREIRDLTEVDREDFLEALRVYYTMDTEMGQAEYGEDFFNYERITAFHSSPRSKFCYHGGLQFLTAHAAFGLMMERSLQAVNPRVSLSFWDYMIDASEFGTEWANSPIFNNSMFGRATGSPDNGYQLTEGRFGEISVIYDPNDTLVGETFSPFHNAYGFINAAYNYQQSPHLIRTNSFCNLEGHSVFATSDVFFACFKNHQSLNAWENCMEKKVGTGTPETRRFSLGKRCLNSMN